MSQHSPTSSSRLRPFKPTAFGRYTLLMPLSVGGMGEIFLARLEGAQGFEKLCVIKKILPHLAQDPDFVSRFVNEAKTLVQLSHGCVAQVLDMGLHDGEPFLALEYVDGKDLRRVLNRVRERNMPLPLTFVLYVMSRVLDALAYAHRKRDDDEKEIGLVHRDVSPQNVLISYEGLVKVIDFGLAKSTLSSSKTNPSIILGKFLYMSPEQAKHGQVDRRSDLYSVGLCLYELLSGKNPFEDVPPGELMGKVASPQIVPIQRVEPLCPPTIAALVTKALQPDPAQRFQTAEEFRGKVMAALLDIDSSAGPESVTRFMRETFAVEYQAERKLLQSLREAARTEVPVLKPPEEHTGVHEPPAPVRNLREPVRPVQDPAGRRSAETAPSLVEVKKKVDASPLSFAPTPRSRVPAKDEPQGDRATSPGVLVDGMMRPDTGPQRPLSEEAAPGEEPVTVSSMPVEPSPQSEPTLNAVPLPSVMVGGGLESKTVDRRPMMTPAGTAAARNGRLSPGSPLVPVSEVRGYTPVIEPLPRPLQSQRPDAMGDTKTKSKRPSIIWVLLPLFAVLGVVGYVGLDLFREHQAKLAEEDDRLKGMGRQSTDDNRTRTRKPEATNVVIEPEAPSIEPVDDNLAPLKQEKVHAPAPPRAPTARAEAKLSPSLKSFNSMKRLYDTLESKNESAVKRLRLRVQQLENQSRSVGPDDQRFIGQCDAMREELKIALAKPENQ